MDKTIAAVIDCESHEENPYGVDFSTRLGAGESLSSVATALTNKATGAVTALGDAATINGTEAWQWVRNLTGGVDYYLRFTVVVAPNSREDTQFLELHCVR